MVTVDLRLGDMRDVLAGLPPVSVSAVVTDPPYGLAFMGHTWDQRVPGPDYWTACLRVLKPGGHLLAFGGTRTVHRLTCAIEDAGFEIRDTITWLYGSGFPKSHDVSKAIDKAAGAAREVVGYDHVKRAQAGNSPDYASCDGSWAHTAAGTRNVWDVDKAAQITSPATDAARQWSGWGTALKPASEPIIVARKPLAGTVAATVLAHGTGALNIDGCRVEGPPPPSVPQPVFGVKADGAGVLEFGTGTGRNGAMSQASAGRWPTNVLLSHLPDCAGPCVDGCTVAELDAQSGTLKSGGTAGKRADRADSSRNPDWRMPGAADYADSAGASRFFPTFRYQAKAPTSERPKIDGKGWPTVKPLGLMRWLVRLVTPPGGLVLDPFAGTGATLKAAELEGFDSLGIERDGFAYRLALQRLVQEGDAPC